MEQFLNKFFPEVVDHHYERNNYCMYDDSGLADFTSCLYIGGFLGTISGAVLSRRCGRRASILLGGASYLVGAVMTAAAMHLPTVVVARILMGFGIGLLNQAVPVYLSEMSDEKHHLAKEICLELALSVGVLISNLVMYGSGKLPEWGWRLSLGLSAIPGASILFIGLLIPETPRSLIQRGHDEKAKAQLTERYGEAEAVVIYDETLESINAESAVKYPYIELLKSDNRPQFVMALLIPMFTQATGISSLMFFAPVIFQAIGYQPLDSELYAGLIIGLVYIVCTLISIAIVMKFDYKPLFYEAGIQMILALVATGFMLDYKLDLHNFPEKWVTASVISLLSIYIAAYTWSWGPLCWMIPTSLSRPELHSATHNFTLSANYIFTYASWRSFLKILCTFHYGTFFYYAGWIFVGTIFVMLFLPETKHLSPDDTASVWNSHWFWKRSVAQAKVNPFSDPFGDGSHNGSAVKIKTTSLKVPEHVVHVPRSSSTGSVIEYDFNWNLY
ncbi:MFS transporter, SP family, sugar:H+ symporter [Marchantia polymorpha subsp. ruderalis]|uniref:Major facilitator superfamily (MFS) profile domain-containing protein n=2 Tax=Marchantia polymorpha TaxID=3197 RepID=A0A176VUN7_MARPO|nr:hypothetical protein AXG93_590s1070 [Marchantia polymorpha subsp. ruderalis]PTQ36312.1 hypothetical protein MARPO_0064s0005 [Marchantia polymorpha]BBN18361.1 hypothetical protein Mp_8g01950 [Marchantia polymorpha subsp. ruderalis]|eukprot:PTQ36312.1 hypothetical protein MARPO_0064s0005 [Marchantia polymorpha]